MSEIYFSDREFGARPRIEEEISEAAWGGIVALITSRIADGSFGYRYPESCPYGGGACGCDEWSFSLALKAEITGINWPLHAPQVPTALAILDLIEFCYRAVGQPIQLDFHQFYRHTPYLLFGHPHLRFKREEGQASFIDDINRILARNGLVYELRSDGSIVRLPPEVLRQSLRSAVFQTGDTELDSMLEAARMKFLDPDLRLRREALEKLWDAWERVKTIEPAKDKKASVAKLLDQASEGSVFREFLENDANALTTAGNTFQIRHSEITQVPLQMGEQVDYMFHRMFALVRLILRRTGRGG